MAFSDFLLTEGIEPKKPVGAIRKKKVVKNRGMINQKNLDQIEFDTTSGNNVKVQFQIRDGVGDVVFYVNDTLDDLGGRKDGSVDPEILGGVLWIVDTYADRLELNGLTFSAWAGKGDTKVVRGLDIEKPREMALNGLREYMKDVGEYKANVIPPTPARIALAKKLGREPMVVYDVNVGKLLRILEELVAEVENRDVAGLHDFEEEVYLSRSTGGGLPDDLMNMQPYTKLEDLIPGGMDVLKLVKQYNVARMSHSEGGASVTRNRRQDLYKRLMDKFFSDKWNVKQERDSFELTRKGVTENVTEDVVGVPKKPAASYSVEQLMFAMFDESFRDYGQYYIPLLSRVIKKIFGDIQGYGWHLTSRENLERLKAIQGTNKSISTLHKKDIAGVVEKGGVASGAEIAVLVKGNVLLKYDINAWTVVDGDGNRWVPVVSNKTGKSISADIESIKKAYVQKLQELAAELRVVSWKEVHDRYGSLSDEQKKKLLSRFIGSMEAFVVENADSIKDNIYGAIDVSEKAMDEVETGFNEIVISDFEIVKVVPIETFKESRKFSDLMVEMPAWNDASKSLSDEIGDATLKDVLDTKTHGGFSTVDQFEFGEYICWVMKRHREKAICCVVGHGNKHIGEFDWYLNPFGWTTESAVVHPEYQGRGIAFYVYKYVIENHMKTLYSDNHLTGEVGKGSFDVWAKLGRTFPYKYVYDSIEDIAEEVDGFTRDMMGDSDKLFVVSTEDILEDV